MNKRFRKARVHDYSAFPLNLYLTCLSSPSSGRSWHDVAGVLLNFMRRGVLFSVNLWLMAVKTQQLSWLWRFGMGGKEYSSLRDLLLKHRKEPNHDSTRCFLVLIGLHLCVFVEDSESHVEYELRGKMTRKVCTAHQTISWHETWTYQLPWTTEPARIDRSTSGNVDKKYDLKKQEPRNRTTHTSRIIIL